MGFTRTRHTLIRGEGVTQVINHPIGPLPVLLLFTIPRLMGTRNKKNKTSYSSTRLKHLVTGLGVEDPCARRAEGGGKAPIPSLAPGASHRHWAPIQFMWGKGEREGEGRWCCPPPLLLETTPPLPAQATHRFETYTCTARHDHDTTQITHTGVAANGARTRTNPYTHTLAST